MGCHRILVISLALVTCHLIISSITRTKISDFIEDFHGDEAVVSWTLNMFEMDIGKHRGICLNGHTGPQQNKTWPSYIDYMDTPPNPDLNNVNIKFLALYFPQWYPIPENNNLDDWRYFYNPEFTRNARSILITRPLNNIYYDPRCLEHRRTQAALAKKYLLDGFIYYFYFPVNRWVLSDVNKQMLLDGEPNLDFALYWVNEFGSYPTLYDHAELLAETLLPFVSHPRYITISGRPILYIYLTSQVPTEYIRMLQETLIEKGVPKLYIIASIQRYGDQLVNVEYADAYAEFPPNIGEEGLSYGYTNWSHTDDYQLSVNINFDNTPRASNGNPVDLPQELTKNREVPKDQPSPEEFRERCVARVTAWYEQTKKEKAILFFAWNEWSEQATLEPSDLHGYEYLEAIRDCRLNVSYLEAPV